MGGVLYMIWAASMDVKWAPNKNLYNLCAMSTQATWHAGPLFKGTPHMDFYNLELSDTNVVDHNTHDFR